MTDTDTKIAILEQKQETSEKLAEERWESHRREDLEFRDYVKEAIGSIKASELRLEQRMNTFISNTETRLTTMDKNIIKATLAACGGYSLIIILLKYLIK